ncbi:MAG: hypothetical protein Q8O42_15395 [Acidobacteriota bacterium]|nr:hypothetical protein [Acidobacteriota bacterium]
MLTFCLFALAASVASAQQETSFQIRTAATGEEFTRRVESATRLASSAWALRALRVETGAPSSTSPPEDGASWIDGDINTRFRQSALMQIKAALSSVASRLRAPYLQDFSLTLGSLDGQLAAVYGPLSTDTIFNANKMTERDRAGKALSDVVLSRLNAFSELASTPNVASVGAIVAYGERDFADSGARFPRGEAVTIVMPAAIVVAYINRTLTVDDVVEKSRVTVCQLLACQAVRPRLP